MLAHTRLRRVLVRLKRAWLARRANMQRQRAMHMNQIVVFATLGSILPHMAHHPRTFANLVGQARSPFIEVM